MSDASSLKLLMSCLADSLARTFQWPENGPVLQLVRDPDSGLSSFALLANYDREWCCWRTLQASMFSEEPPSLEILPKSGMTLCGSLYELPMLAHRIDANAGFAWPTITVNGNYNRVGASPTSGNGLATEVKHWPTVTLSDAKGGRTKEALAAAGRKPTNLLVDAIRHWPTPAAWDAYQRGTFKRDPVETSTGALRHLRKNGGTSLMSLEENVVAREASRADAPTGQGQLNPDWVEILQGYPIGWTSLDGPPAPATSSTPMSRPASSRALRTACRASRRSAMRSSPKSSFRLRSQCAPSSKHKTLRRRSL